MKTATSILLKFILLPPGLLVSLTLFLLLATLVVLLSPVLILFGAIAAGNWLSVNLLKLFDRNLSDLSIPAILGLQGVMSLLSLPVVAVVGPVVGAALTLLIIPIGSIGLGFKMAFSAADKIVNWLFGSDDGYQPISGNEQNTPGNDIPSTNWRDSWRDSLRSSYSQLRGRFGFGETSTESPTSSEYQTPFSPQRNSSTFFSPVSATEHSLERELEHTDTHTPKKSQ